MDSNETSLDVLSSLTPRELSVLRKRFSGESENEPKSWDKPPSSGEDEGGQGGVPAAVVPND